jgi:hypothetical protein
MDNNFCFPFEHNFRIPDSILSIYNQVPYPLQTTVSKDLFDSRIYDWLMCENIEVSWCEAHFKPPLPVYLKISAYGTIHADGDNLDNKTKINFVFGGNGSSMIWYKFKNSPRINRHFTGLKTASVRPTDIRDIEEVYRCSFRSALCNVGQLHSIENPDEDRACVQFIIRDAITKQRIDFSDAVLRMKKLVQLIET